ncbi:MAG TPA: flavin reductase family protein [Verrucomicrobiota bacterium]|nr:flavin reductase family protein [Verrucomicrobiota bacterium]HNU52735.1 flavin reductase family protein [Verrucomicrobiota bacterium]
MKKSLGPKTLVYPTPVFAIGTYDSLHRPNVMIVAWAGICNSQPPSVAISLRKATHSYGNLVRRQVFTLSVPSEDHVQQADYCGLVSGREMDKFAATGLTPTQAEHVDAPYVAEFPLVLECKIVHTIELGLHTQFVGQILDVKADESVLGPGDSLDIKKVRPLLFAPDTQSYYGVGEFVAKAFSTRQPPK